MFEMNQLLDYSLFQLMWCNCLGRSLYSCVICCAGSHVAAQTAAEAGVQVDRLAVHPKLLQQALLLLADHPLVAHAGPIGTFRSSQTPCWDRRCTLVNCCGAHWLQSR